MPAQTKRASRATSGHIDVRGKKDVSALEKLLKKSKDSKTTVFVLVYMNGCGPCERYKADYWNNYISRPGMNNMTASVHYDQVPHIPSFRNKELKLKGYPSVLELVDGVPREYRDEENNGEITNAISSSSMRNLPLPGSANMSRSSTNVTPGSFMNVSPGSPMNLSPGSPMNLGSNNDNSILNSLSNTNANVKNLSQQLYVSPPGSQNEENSPGASLLTNNMVSPQKGGALLESMLAIAKDPGVLTAALLTLTAAGVVSMNKKKGTRRRRRRQSRKNL
jgi:hypothetical protein